MTNLSDKSVDYTFDYKRLAWSQASTRRFHLWLSYLRTFSLRRFNNDEFTETAYYSRVAVLKMARPRLRREGALVKFRGPPRTNVIAAATVRRGRQRDRAERRMSRSRGWDGERTTERPAQGIACERRQDGPRKSDGAGQKREGKENFAWKEIKIQKDQLEAC